jgi:hypothetical protein
MKRNMIYLLLIISALFTFGQTAAEARVNKVGKPVLSPVAWHPNPNKIHENYPFDLNEKSTGDTDSAKLLSTQKKRSRNRIPTLRCYSRNEKTSKDSYRVRILPACADSCAGGGLR